MDTYVWGREILSRMPPHRAPTNWATISQAAVMRSRRPGEVEEGRGRERQTGEGKGKGKGKGEGIEPSSVSAQLHHQCASRPSHP
jgi:hypothetical protein